jgi:hypothetical protein
MSVYKFDEQCWTDQLRQDLIEAIKPGEDLIVEVHARVNSVMIGALIESADKCREVGVKMEVVAFNRSSECSLEFFNMRKLMRVRQPTYQERMINCLGLCDEKCLDPYSADR